MGPRFVRVHAEAPAKAAIGDECSGCGLCCLLEPCPAAIAFTGRLRGACTLLRWDDAGRRYRCGLIGDTPTRLWGSTRIAAWAGRQAPRWIAAGVGCDTDLQVDDAH